MKVLSIFTKALLDRGVDYEVTLRGSEVTVRLFDQLEGVTIAQDTSDSLETALATVLATVASGKQLYNFTG